MNWIFGIGALLVTALVLYQRYVMAGLREQVASVEPLSQTLHETGARVSSLEAEITGLHAKAREIDEKEAQDIIDSGDRDRAIGFLRDSLRKGGKP